jgi:hypothetical protein
MSVTFNPDEMAYAVVEYLKSSDHIYDPVDSKLEKDGQYRFVCLAVKSEDAWRVAHLLRAIGDGRYWYSVCVAEPEATIGEPLPLIECNAP